VNHSSLARPHRRLVFLGRRVDITVKDVASSELIAEEDYLDVLSLLTSTDLRSIQEKACVTAPMSPPQESEYTTTPVLTSSSSEESQDPIVFSSVVPVVQQKRKAEVVSLGKKEKDFTKKPKKEQCSARRNYVKWPPYCITAGREWKLNSIVILYEMENMVEKQQTAFKKVMAHDAIPIENLPGFYFVNLAPYFPPTDDPEKIWNNTKYKRFARKGLGSLSSFNKRDVVEKYWDEYKKNISMI